MNNLFDHTILDAINNAIYTARVGALILGGVAGSGGGSGGPIGGIVGYLPQTKVAYDLSEIASSGIPASGESLLDNLNHIRYRVDQLEIDPGGITILDDGVIALSGAQEIDFLGAEITISGNRATVVISGGAPNHIYNEDLTSQVPGSGFTTSLQYIHNTLRVYYNGIRERVLIDYNEIDPYTSFITTFPTYSGDIVIVDYDYTVDTSTFLVDTDSIIIIDNDGQSLN